mmetsp:Transcript_163/g.263  ORF Transcript_163/g.263 Transcript_163/m.263 type:complete len:211 (+) Transcript_163:1001-1633(+)
MLSSWNKLLISSIESSVLKAPVSFDMPWRSSQLPCRHSKKYGGQWLLSDGKMRRPGDQNRSLAIRTIFFNVFLCLFMVDIVLAVFMKNSNLKYPLFADVEEWEKHYMSLMEKEKYLAAKFKRLGIQLKTKMNHSIPFVKAVPLESDFTVKDPYVSNLGKEIDSLYEEYTGTWKELSNCWNDALKHAMKSPHSSDKIRLPWPRPNRSAMFD